MSAGLRDRQLTVCNPAPAAQQVVNGLPQRVYLATPATWGRIDPPTGREVTAGLGADHRIDGVCLLHQDMTVSRNGVIRDEDGVYWEVRAVQTRRETMEQQLYLERSEKQAEYTVMEVGES
jgi:hypothetical protein